MYARGRPQAPSPHKGTHRTSTALSPVVRRTICFNPLAHLGRFCRILVDLTDPTIVVFPLAQTSDLDSNAIDPSAPMAPF